MSECSQTPNAPAGSLAVTHRAGGGIDVNVSHEVESKRGRRWAGCCTVVLNSLRVLRILDERERVA